MARDSGPANVRRAREPSNVRQYSLEHGRIGCRGMALAKALNAKTTVITVTEPLPVIEYVSGHAGGGISQQDWDAACKVRAGKVLDEARAMAEQIGISVELLHVSDAHPATAIIETAKSSAWPCDATRVPVSGLSIGTYHTKVV
jgi:hypothetical protein